MKKKIRLTEAQLRKLIKKAIRESEYTDDIFASNQRELAYQNGDEGNYLEDVTVIKFKDGTEHEVDEHDDINDIKKDLAKNGYYEGRDYRIVDTQKTRYWSI